MIHGKQACIGTRKGNAHLKEPNLHSCGMPVTINYYCGKTSDLKRSQRVTLKEFQSTLTVASHTNKTDDLVKHANYKRSKNGTSEEIHAYETVAYSK